MSEPAIKVELLSKRYRIGAQLRKQDLRETVAGMIAAPLRRLKSVGRASHREEDSIWALRDVSFEVRPGEVLGVIGPNGAGKSTLLKILSRITEPTSGRAVFNGRVASLLEVGTGFHEQLTGHENIYLGGAILGLKRAEIAARYDEIVEFSGVEKFLNTPLKWYSSGMRVRLGFAVAAHLDSEILLVDEVLAVGDAAFQRRSLGKMEDLGGQGRTVLFVSHNMGAVTRLCGAAICLEEGRVVDCGASTQVVQDYLARGYGGEENASCEFPADITRAMCLRRAEIVSSRSRQAGKFEMNEPLRVAVAYDVNVPVTGAHVICFIYTAEGVNVLGSGDADCARERLETRRRGRYRGEFEIPAFLLGEGRYTLGVSLGVPFMQVYDRRDHCLSFAVTDQRSSRRREWLHQRRPGILGMELPWSYPEWAE
jgi:lipopolysaccharide transport system ATP-binding protein